MAPVCKNRRILHNCKNSLLKQFDGETLESDIIHLYGKYFNIISRQNWTKRHILIRVVSFCKFGHNETTLFEILFIQKKSEAVNLLGKSIFNRSSVKFSFFSVL